MTTRFRHTRIKPVVAASFPDTGQRKSNNAFSIDWVFPCGACGWSGTLHLATRPNCGYYHFTIGDFEATIVSDGAFVFPPQGLVSTIPKPALENVMKRNFESLDAMVLANNILFLDTGKNKVLIDTGSSNLFQPTVGRLIGNLAAADIDFIEIDTVLISHAHVDHIGGISTPDGPPAFPKARYFISRAEHDFWKDATLDDLENVADEDLKQLLLDVAKDSLDKISDSLTLFEFGEELVPGITSKDLSGHTPGMAGFDIKSGNSSLLYTADAVLNEYISIPQPEWAHDSDMNATKAIETRFALLEELTRSGKMSATFHVDFPGIGHIRRDGSKYDYRPVRHRLEF
ncbi:hypothetical protein BSKO_07206 [Bryopsis sp. KO-2023]|nr:hypothetical protein BSKO_07206 [Bryopsis sp. KO-2023]